MSMTFNCKTEWLDQMRRLAKCGSAEDIDSFYDALGEYLESGERTQGTDLAEMVLTPIISEMEHEKDKHDKRVAAGKARWSSNAQAMVEQCSSNARDMLKQCSSNAQAKKEIKEKEKKQKKENTEKEVYASSVDNTCSNNSSVLSPSDACAEPEKSDSAPEAPPIASLLLNDGTEFAVTQDIYDRLARTYPAVDTMQQLREIENWCFSNPKNRKTRNGVMRFINSWFSREQDKGLVPKYRQRNQQPPRLTAEEIYNLPAISPWETGG